MKTAIKCLSLGVGLVFCLMVGLENARAQGGGGGGGGTTTAAFNPTSFIASAAVGSSVSGTINLINQGSASLNITTIALAGANTVDFTLGGTCANGGVVPAKTGNFCTIQITFHPTSAGVQNASVAASFSNAPGISLPLTGTGLLNTPVISANNAPINFGNVTVGIAPPAVTAFATIVVTNSGGVSLTLSALTFSGANPGDFLLGRTNNGVSNCIAGDVLAPLSSCFVGLNFKPTRTGPRSAVFSLVSNDPVTPALTIALSGNGVKLGDYDGDGITDVAVYRPSVGAWFILPSGTPSSSQFALWGLPTDIPVPGDYDGDGKTDIAVYRPGTGAWFILPSGTPNTSKVEFWGLPTDIPVPGDYDGDGKTDIAVYRPSTGAWFILPSGTPNTSIVELWGLSTDIAVPGDYDGDGKTDIAVWRPSTGQWFILLSGTPGTSEVVTWGLSTDVPVPGDYDGDGKTDIAVYRPGTPITQWYILPSASPGTFNFGEWGVPGDIPVPADYDGDGKTDMAIYRPSTGSWSAHPSSAPATFKVITWGLSTDVPLVKTPH